MVADFRRFYTMDLPDSYAGLDEGGWLRCSELYARLPRESIAARRADPDNGWPVEALLLRDVEFRLHNLVWLMSDEGRRGVNAPRPIPTPGDGARAEQARADAAAAKADIAGIFGIDD